MLSKCCRGPEDISDNELDTVIHVYKIAKMKDMFSSNEIDITTLKDYFSDTFIIQKKDIRERKLTTLDLKQKWPGLFSFEGLTLYINVELSVTIDLNVRRSLDKNGDKFKTSIKKINNRRPDMKVLQNLVLIDIFNQCYC